jgi:hypothetical protein
MRRHVGNRSISGRTSGQTTAAMLLPGMKHTRSLLDVSIRVLEYFATHATARNWLAVLWKCRADATDWHARSLECHLNSSACHPGPSDCRRPSNCRRLSDCPHQTAIT